MTDREALKLALETLENLEHSNFKRRRLDALIAVKQALAQPAQLVSWTGDGATNRVIPLPVQDGREKVRVINGIIHTLEWTPQVMRPAAQPPLPVQRTWVGLTGEDFSAIKFPAEMRFPAEFRAGARWAEAKLKEKNT